jgi:basic membrane lipoprotein Med (substrate-binding protein (PBP1-ABC) superfamily)
LAQDIRWHILSDGWFAAACARKKLARWRDPNRWSGICFSHFEVCRPLLPAAFIQGVLMRMQTSAAGLAVRRLTPRRLLAGAAIVLAATMSAFTLVAQADGKVAMLLPGSINDQSWNANGYGADFVFGKLNAGHTGIIQAAKEGNVYTSGRSFGHVETAPQNVLTAIIEKWSDMYVAAATDVKAGKLKAELITYGYNAPSGSGADLMYAKDKTFNAVVPKEIIAEIEAVKKKLASGEIKVTVAKEDARGGT